MVELFQTTSMLQRFTNDAKVYNVCKRYKGWEGLQGFHGLQGFQRLQRMRRFTNDAKVYNGCKRYKGWESLQDFQGLQGLQGLQGFQGLQGLQGLQGFRGFRGFQGFQGFRGFQGFQGLQGFHRLQTIDSIFQNLQIARQRSKLQQILREIFYARVQFVELWVDVFFVGIFNVDHSTFECLQQLANLKYESSIYFLPLINSRQSVDHFLKLNCFWLHRPIC
jgi:hypothetical protein